MWWYRLAARRYHWMARLRGECLRWRIRLAGGDCGRALWAGRGVVFKYPPHSGIRLGDRVRIGEYAIIDVPVGASLEIGDEVTCSMGVVLAAQSSIRLGRAALVGEYVSIRDADHGMALVSRIRDQPMVTAPVVIGQDVWIGRGTCVLKGGTMGDRTVVGANSVVARSMDAAVAALGAPARVLKVRV